MKTAALSIAITVCATTIGGCAAQTAQQPNANPGFGGMYENKRQSELNSERQDFINEKQQALQDVDREIQHVQVKLEHEAQFVDQEQKADWSQELFELKQERQSLQARLDRAQNASDAEWSEMRGFLGGAVDSLQAAVGTLGGQVEQAVGGDQNQQNQQNQQKPTAQQNQ